MMKSSIRARAAATIRAGCQVLVPMLAMGSTASAGARDAVELEHAIAFQSGTPKARTMLAKIASVRDLVTGPFQVATVDLNDDGRKEILVMGASLSYCGSGGCLLVVLEQQGNKMVTLLNRNLPHSLGVTKGKIGAYRALVALDDKGVVAIADKPGAPLHGKSMIYPMAGATGVTPPAPSRATSPSPPSDADAASVAGIRLGMSAAEAEAALRSHALKYGGQMQVQFGGALTATGPDGKAVGSGYRYLLQGSKNVGPVVDGVRSDGVLVLLSPPVGVQRVVAVHRSVLFGDNDRVAPEALRDQLASRHGKPSFVLEDAVVLWFLDKSQRSMVPPSLPKVGPNPSVLTHCGMFDHNNPPWNVLPTSLKWPAQIRNDPRLAGLYRECGTVLGLSMSKSTAGAVMGFRTQLMDHPAFIDSVVGAHDYLQPQADAAKARDLEAARKRGAPKI